MTTPNDNDQPLRHCNTEGVHLSNPQMISNPGVEAAVGTVAIISCFVCVIYWTDPQYMLNFNPNTVTGYHSQPPGPRECDLEDIISDSPDAHIWNRQWDWYFLHIPKTMGGTVMEQLPAEYRSKFNQDPRANQVTAYEHKHGVKLRSISRRDVFPFPGHKTTLGHPAHIPLDIAVKMGLLRCSDIEQMSVISIVREPMAREISLCNWLSAQGKERVHNVSGMVEILRRGRPKQADWLEFEYDWNVTVFTMESTDQITSWFAQFGINVLFDEHHHQHQTKRKQDVCHVDDLNDEDMLFLQEWLAKDIRFYEAIRNNGGSMKIKHHAQWIRD